MLFSEQSGGSFVQALNFFAHAGDFALESNLVSLGRDGAVLQPLITCGGGGEVMLGNSMYNVYLFLNRFSCQYQYVQCH